MMKISQIREMEEMEAMESHHPHPHHHHPLHQSHKSNNTGKIPFLKLYVNFFPMFNGEVNAEKLDNWIRQLEVYLRIQNLQDEDTKV